MCACDFLDNLTITECNTFMTLQTKGMVNIISCIFDKEAAHALKMGLRLLKRPK